MNNYGNQNTMNSIHKENRSLERNDLLYIINITISYMSMIRGFVEGNPEAAENGLFHNIVSSNLGEESYQRICSTYKNFILHEVI
jgi:hypothetical protein